MHFRRRRKAAQDVSLSELIETGKDGNALPLMEVVASEEDLFESLSGREMAQRLHEAMERCLTPREKTILTLRYGLGGRTPLPQREIAAQCRISRSYVSRIEKKALQKLEKEMEDFR